MVVGVMKITGREEGDAFISLNTFATVYQMSENNKKYTLFLTGKVASGKTMAARRRMKELSSQYDRVVVYTEHGEDAYLGEECFSDRAAFEARMAVLASLNVLVVIDHQDFPYEQEVWREVGDAIVVRQTRPEDWMIRRNTYIVNEEIPRAQWCA
jgi:Cdc6-like AAA superfamily ATPase